MQQLFSSIEETVSTEHFSWAVQTFPPSSEHKYPKDDFLNWPIYPVLTLDSFLVMIIEIGNSVV